MDPLINIESVTVSVSVETSVVVKVNTEIGDDFKTGSVPANVAAGTPVGASGPEA